MYISKIKRSRIQTAQLDTEILMAKALGKDRKYIVLNNNKDLLNENLEYFKNISEFSRIFDIRYYRLGKIGRSKINNRLNLKLNNQIQTIK